MNLPELTEAQAKELWVLVDSFIADRALDGFHCVVLLDGRGIRKSAFNHECAEHAPAIMAAAWGDITRYNAQKAERAAQDDLHHQRRDSQSQQPVGG